MKDEEKMKESKEYAVELKRLSSNEFNLIIKTNESVRFDLLFDMFDLTVLYRVLCDIFKEDLNG